MPSVDGIGGNDETLAEDAVLFDNVGSYVMWASLPTARDSGLTPSCPQWTVSRHGTSSAG
jgi:hypothetical protein